ncbi:MAG TPA: penicillin-binding protein activator LpoB [Desulfomicrobiaceae bacterium]|nr:penicillin-binding protein activator LpoB [Desulfomicrobiaceae bacterium]
MRHIGLFVAALIMILMAGCSSGYHVQYLAPQPERKASVSAAVLPLVNLTTYPHAGRIVGDLLSTELHRIPGLRFAERTALQETLRGNAEDMARIMDRAVALKTGRTLGVERVFYGSVTEYRYKRGLDQNPAVGINLRLLDVTTGRELWSASMTKTGTCFWECSTAVNQVAQEVCHDMVSGMISAMNSNRPRQ